MLGNKTEQIVFKTVFQQRKVHTQYLLTGTGILLERRLVVDMLLSFVVDSCWINGSALPTQDWLFTMLPSL